MPALYLAGIGFIAGFPAPREIPIYVSRGINSARPFLHLSLPFVLPPPPHSRARANYFRSEFSARPRALIHAWFKSLGRAESGIRANAWAIIRVGSRFTVLSPLIQSSCKLSIGKRKSRDACRILFSVVIFVPTVDYVNVFMLSYKCLFYAMVNIGNKLHVMVSHAIVTVNCIINGMVLNYISRHTCPIMSRAEIFEARRHAKHNLLWNATKVYKIAKRNIIRIIIKK